MRKIKVSKFSGDNQSVALANSQNEAAVSPWWKDIVISAISELIAPDEIRIP